MFIIFIIFIQSTLSAKCSKRQYLNDEGKCVLCESGYYCPGDDNEYECPDGYYTPFKQKECIKCGCDGCLKKDIVNETTNDIIKHAGSCAVEGTCYPGYGYNELSNKRICELCKPGYYSKGGDNICRLCPRFHITTEYGQTECKRCPELHGVTNVHTVCEKCPPGSYLSDDGYCSRCYDNTVTTEYGQIECTECGDEYHANEDHTKCLPGPYIIPELHRTSERRFPDYSWANNEEIMNRFSLFEKYKSKDE